MPSFHRLDTASPPSLGSLFASELLVAFDGIRVTPHPGGLMVRQVAFVVVCAFLLSTAPSPAAKVRVEGSDTIGGALGPDLAEAFHQRQPATFVEWEALGSSTAFVGLFDGSADLGASSRPVREEELAEAKRLGIQLREWVLGYDGIAVIVHPDNPLPVLTVQQASEIFRGRIRNYREVGGPDRSIRLLARPSYSGTHSFFKEKVLRRGNAKGPEEFAETTEWVEHSSEIVTRVAADPSAISFVGLGWVKPNVHAVPLAAGRGLPAVAPTLATVRDGSYPVFRALYLYSRGEPQGPSRDLLAFALSPAGQELVARNGFVANLAPSPLALSSTAPSSPTLDAPSGLPEPAATPAVAAAVPGRSAAPAPAPIAIAAAPELIRVYFAFGGTRITEEGELKLHAVATQLARGGVTAEIVGHADATGDPEANRRVSLARALTVRAELARLGAPGATMVASGRGSEQPIASNEAPEGRRQNRRVDILLTSRR